MQMNKMNFKSKFSLFSKHNAHKSVDTDISPKDAINQNAIWFQSMEPISYAKNQTKELYEINDTYIDEVDTKIFRDQLFKILKIQMDHNKKLIKNKFLATSDGSLNVGLNVILIDSLLKVIFKNSYFHSLGNKHYQFTLIAVGGYGRGELSPHSDLDILFLLPNKLRKNDTKKIENVVELILYILWDLGYTVGHSTRTIDDCIEKSRSDLTISTSLLEKRFVAGNNDIYDLLNNKFKTFIDNTKTLDFVEAKLKESETRHKRFGESRYVVEPNVKDGKGGLRDLHTLIWILKFAYKVDTISKLINVGALTKEEAVPFAEAQRFLLSVRCHLHYRANREDDRLAMDAQLEIAKSMNFKNTITHKDVERFMKRYFLATKTVGNLTRIFCAAIETEFNKPLRMSFLSFKKRENITPFRLEVGRLFSYEREILTENPINIIKLFYISHINNIDIHPKTLRQITSLRKLINLKVRQNVEANKMFLNILTSDKDPTRTLRLMNEANILGQFIPEFQKIVGLMQFDMYHSYTVDEHTIFTISNLHSLRSGKFSDFAPLTSSAILEIKSYKSLFVAMLLHDIAKGKKGDHSENGSLIASKICPRLGLNKEETKMVEWLVLHHLLMSKTAFRYELGDPKVIKNFAKQVRSIDKLKSLLALTVADIRGVGPDVWNDWKGALIKELYIKTYDLLKPPQEISKITEPLKSSKELLIRYLNNKGVNDLDIKTYCSKFYNNYWGTFNLPSVVNHYEIFTSMKNYSKKLEVYLSNDSKLKATELLVITPDHHGLFSQISGLVASSGYDIVSAKIITRSDGYALDTFFLQNKERKPISDINLRKKLIETITKGLEGNFNIEKALNIKWKEIPARFRAVKAPIRVIIDNKTSDQYTILDIKCKNAPGVLYKITKIITSLGLQINTANVSTYGDRVVDIFYLKNAFGSKVDDNTTIEKVKNSILEELKEIDYVNQ
jgi:[protein-PII] uridylyltransferase